MKTIRILPLILLSSLILDSCAYWERQSTTTKTGSVGAATGGLAGILIDSHNPWRGGVIGAALGAVSGVILGDIINHSAQEAAQHNASVKYSRTTENGTNEEVVATPQGTKDDYKLVSIKYVQDGKVMGEEMQRVPLN